MSNQGTSPWTAEITDALREDWAAGKSCSLIASDLNKRFGTQFTSNAIVGKIDRLGLPSRVTKFSIRGILYTRPKYVAPEIPQIDDSTIPVEQRKTLFDLGPHDCRWPVGNPKEPNFFFCGAQAVENLPYCPAHCAKAFNEWVRKPHEGIQANGLPDSTSQQCLQAVNLRGVGAASLDVSGSDCESDGNEQGAVA